jgi:subfamily B ATP-binding cassette protein MsbA
MTGRQEEEKIGIQEDAIGYRLPATGSPERRLLGYLWPLKKLFLLSLVCTAGISAIEVTFVFLISRVLKATIEKNPGLLDKVALLIIGIHMVKWVFSYGQTCFISAAMQKIAVRLRNDLYSHLQSLSLSYFERTKVGHLISRMTSDVALVQNSASQITQLVSSPLTIIGTMVLIFKWNWRLAAVSLVILPFMSYAITRIGHGMRGLTQAAQVRLADVAAIIQETLSATRIVKAFGMEEYEKSRFAEENQRSYGAAMRAVRRSAAISPTVEVLGIAGIAFVLWYGGNMVTKNSVPGFTTDVLIGFLFGLERIATSVRNIAGINVTYQQAMAGAERIFDVLDETPDVMDAPDASPMSPMEGRVEFRDVSFAYNSGGPVLQQVSFVAEPGKQIALVGPSGAGKSTIANLIPRFYDVTDGAVLIDGTDIRRVTAHSLRDQIAIVPQETMLFSSSIRENISYGRIGASEQEVVEAAKAANADDFIRKLPQGYDTLVGERGVRLSGGERQRIAIARALLKNPKLLILDEATSSLDTASEAVVQEALDRLMSGRTTLVIAHRLSTVVNADLILALDGGRIVESGTHSELLARGGLYAGLYSAQKPKNPTDEQVYSE